MGKTALPRRRFRFLEPDFGAPPRLTRRVVAMLLLICVAYSVVAFVYLGTTDVPQTYITTEKFGEQFVFCLEKPESLGQIYIYKGYGASYATVYGANSMDGPWELMCENALDQHHQWVHFAFKQAPPKKYVRLDVKDANIEICEVSVLERQNADILKLTPVTHSNDAEAASRLARLTDEQDMLDHIASPMTYAYFDEFLYNSTAQRFIASDASELPEITHPPLGKDIMALGLMIFGMNSLGWRIMGTLVGIIMVPVMFFLARRVLRNNNWALVAAGLLSVDFMHFTQTRMATIDSYPLFFIMLSYIFMMKFFSSETRRAEIASLFACGAFFGLSCASKWIGIYSGIGLALCFFYFLACKVHAKRKLARANPPVKKRGIVKYIAVTLLLCIAFFVIVPAGIYTASYIPYMQMDNAEYSGIQGMLDNQSFMLNFHESVADEFDFASPWWSWPLCLRPINLYNCEVSSGIGSRIVTMGNPLIWWISVPCIVFAFVLWIRGVRVSGAAFCSITPLKKRGKYFYGPPAPRQLHPDAGIIVVIVAYLCQYVPWIPISRPLFIYHYFAPATLSIIAIVYVLKYFAQRFRKGVYVARAYVPLCVAMFAAFFPVISGVYVYKGYFDIIRWMPWPF